MNIMTFTALSEPTRLRIVELLKDRPYSVNEIASILNLNQPQVSKHLKVLADSGLVQIQPLAQRRIYSLSHEPLKELDRWIQKYRKLWEASFDRLEALLIDEKKVRR